MELFRASHSLTDGQDASKGVSLQYVVTAEEDATATPARTRGMRARMVTKFVMSLEFQANSVYNLSPITLFKKEVNTMYTNTLLSNIVHIHGYLEDQRLRQNNIPCFHY